MEAGSEDQNIDRVQERSFRDLVTQGERCVVSILADEFLAGGGTPSDCSGVLWRMHHCWGSKVDL